MNVVFIGAHPDDEMFCLGTLLLDRKRGDPVSLICATNGDKGISDDPDFPHAECARLHDQEMREVARAIDAEYHGLGSTQRCGSRPGGSRKPGEGPGLGVEIDEETIMRFRATGA